MLNRQITVSSALCALSMSFGCGEGAVTASPDACPPPCLPGADGADRDPPEGPDAAGSDAEVIDAAAPDTAVPDGAVPDAVVTDAAAPDAAPDELVVCANGGDYQVIGQAIAAAAPGATIQVCPGTYFEQLTVTGKPLHIVGVDGAAVTILDGGSQGRVLDVLNTGQSGLRIEGFTLQNGSATGRGGGVRCAASTLVLRESVVLDSSALEGGGLYASDCSLQLVETRLEENVAEERGGAALVVDSSGAMKDGYAASNEARYGGAVAVDSGDFSVLDSTFVGNWASLRGGALHHASDAPIERSAFVGNGSGWTGGGLYIDESAPLVEDNEVRDNTSENDGGGLYLYQADAVLRSNLIKANSTNDDGGGLRIFEANALIEDNRIEGNLAADSGGGVRVSHLPSEFYDNEIVDNQAVGVGGGMDLDNDSSIVSGGVIEGNIAFGSGGGIHAWLFPWSGGTIADVRIAQNSAWQGGGIYLQHNHQTVTMENLVVAGNTAADGAGIAVRTSPFILRRSSFAGNTASEEGGAISVGLDGSSFDDPCPCPPSEATGSIQFVVAHDNEAPDGGAAIWARSPSLDVGSSIFYSNTGTAVLIEDTAPTWTYNDVSPASFQGMTDPTGSDGNIEADPQFADAGAGDFHIQSGSACIDAGDPDYVDLDGTRADMGRYGGLGGTP